MPRRAPPITLGGDKGFDAADFIMEPSRNQRDAARGPKHDPPVRSADRRGDDVIRATTSASVFENGSKRASDG